ncbi:MAG: putative dehydrogenase [Verrucomicrobiales bacterium]|jgi:predicted dehydrogenase
MGKTGFDYAPSSRTLPPVVEPGEFIFSVAGLDHGHIFGQTNGLCDAGATLKQVWDPDRAKVDDFLQRYPDAERAESFQQLLDDEETRLIASAVVSNERADLGIEVLRAGKAVFVDKPPLTTLEQLSAVRSAVAETGQRFFCYYSERIHNESSMKATELIDAGSLGEILQIICLAPHRMSLEARPRWFFEKEKYGGILADLGSHQFEQFLRWTGADDGVVNFARTTNFTVPDEPGLEDFGEASVTMNSGASCYTRVDWLTADGQRVWGDGRCFIVGTKGTMELRKYTDVGVEGPGNRIFLVTAEGEEVIDCEGTVGFPFFGELILDVLNGTENAMTQAHIFKAAELALKAQAFADQKSG